jgi:hypothetical protein
MSVKTINLENVAPRLLTTVWASSYGPATGIALLISFYYLMRISELKRELITGQLRKPSG